MMGGFSGLVSRAKSSLLRDSDRNWLPDAPLPSGFQSKVQQYSLRVGTFSTLSFNCAGHWAKGTVSFERETAWNQVATDGSTVPPAYGNGQSAEAHAGGADKLGEVKVTVEARYNSEELFKSCRIGTVERDHEAGVYIEAPESAKGPLAASLSYHVRILIPASLQSLNAINVAATKFRLLFAPELSALHIANLELSTSDAPIRLTLDQVGKAKISNLNRLNPDKTRLKNFDLLLSGRIVATDGIDIKCGHGGIAGEYRTTYPKAPLRVETTNFAIEGTYESAGALIIVMQNANISGRFIAKGQLNILTQYGRIDGHYRGEQGIKIATQYSPVKATFEVGQDFTISDYAMPIDAQITLLSRATISQQASAAAAAGTAPLDRPSTETNGERRGSFEPPSFEQALRNGATSTSRAMDSIKVHFETTDCHVHVEYMNQPKDVVLVSAMVTTGGSPVTVSHPKEWEGNFNLSTHILALAQANINEASSAFDGGPKKIVNYSTKKRWELVGSVTFDESTKLRNSSTAICTGPITMNVAA